MPSFYKKHQVYFFVGQHANLERIYSLLSFTKRLNFSTGQSAIQNEFPSYLNTDAPAFFSLNRSVASFTENGHSVVAKIGGILFTGVNPRFESSLLNTTIRREQLRRAFPISRLNVFTSVRFSNNNTSHRGNSLTSLQSLIENRSDFVTTKRTSVPNYLLYQGAVFSQSNHFSFFEKQFSLLAKRLFVKTSQYNSFGTIHSSVASLAFCNIGNVGKKVGTPVPASDKQQRVVFNVDNFQGSTISKGGYLSKIFPKVSKDTYAPFTTFNYTTHLVHKSSGDFIFPRTSLYERSGHFVVLEGRLRKHSKAVSKPKQAFSLETILSVFARRQDFTF